jgi:hypothetical protein
MIIRSEPVLTCYLRHLRGIFKMAGIEVTGDKREVDRLIHRIVGTGYEDYPKTWDMSTSLERVFIHNNDAKSK